mgnify:CR=1 FL=1
MTGPAAAANQGHSQGEAEFPTGGDSPRARPDPASGRFAGIAAAALVVDGGIYRHDFVAQAVVTGLMEAQLATGVPVFSVSLTPHHFQPKSEHETF